MRDRRGGLLGVAAAAALFLGASIAAAAQQKGEAGRERESERVSRYSDRDRRSAWEKGRTELQQALRTGEERGFYKNQLEKLGYKVTSVNYDRPDYVEYEIVKGDQTYEIQIDFDKAGGRANKVEVATNMWKAEATEKALEQAGRGRQEARGEQRRGAERGEQRKGAER